MKKATLVSVIVVVFLAGSAFGFFVFSAVASRQTYALAFSQEGVCSPPMYGAPWAVALNGRTTIVAPSSAALPLPNTVIQGSAGDVNYSVIWFHVPNGVYTYVVMPTDFFPNGTVTVSGSDTIVSVIGPFIGCTTTAAVT
jgi:hypothetical protein